MTGFRMFFNKPAETPAQPAQKQDAPMIPRVQQVQQKPVQASQENPPRPTEQTSKPPVSTPVNMQDPMAAMRPPSMSSAKTAVTEQPSAGFSEYTSAPAEVQQVSPPTMSSTPAPAPVLQPVAVSSRPQHYHDEANEMAGMEKKDIDSILEKMGVPKSRIKIASDRKKMTGETIAEIMRDFGFLGPEKVAEAMALNAGLEYFPPSKMDSINGQSIQPLKSVLPPGFENFAPISFNGQDVIIAIADPKDSTKAVNYFHGYRPKTVIASDNTVLSIYRRFFSSSEEMLDSYLKRFMEILLSRDEDLEKQPGLMRDILGSLLRHACQIKASDIHMHMTEKVGLIKLTVDGVSTIFRSVPKELYDRMLQKLVMDGRVKAEDLRSSMQESSVEFSSEQDMKLYDDLFSRYGFRLQLGDAKGGYTAVIRILDRSSNAAELKSLRFDAKALDTMKRYIATPTGLVLVTGPTGSGKTTSLYAMLKEIDPVTRSIQTIENPVEYRHGLWMQYELARGSKEEGSEWGKFLKGLLRNAPKVILMGEVRDADTARTLLDAANTGHLVFTTLHTNNAPTAISRLRKLGVDMDALASELLGVLAQRLVRTLCHHCRVPDSRESTLDMIDPNRNPFLKNFPRSPHMAATDGCPHCNYTGYVGRRIIYELLDVTPAVRKLIEQNKPTSEIAANGIRPGFSMWECGLKLVTVGETSIEALMSVSQQENYNEE